jgi:hypothetical protein
MNKMQKSVQIFNCDSCDYNTSSTRDFNKHLLTAKHKNATNNATLAIIGNEKVAREKIHYNCKCCDYETNRKWSYDKHLLSEKHKKNISGEPTEVIYNCSRCNKEYLSYNAFWKHKKQCVIIEEREPEKNTITREIFMEVFKESKELQNVLIEQNKELQNKLLEQNAEHHKQMLELASKQTNHINSHNTNNNHFNLQFFLNETCKDAMNIVDFINSLKLTIEDFETTGRLGFVDGISKIFVKELKKLEIEKLPIHCTDLKRETVYIKDNDIWEKENEEKKKLKWAIDTIAKLNFNQNQSWQEKYPECRENNTKENQKFFKLASVALGGQGKEEEEKFREKIMKNVLKEVLLDKKRIVL